MSSVESIISFAVVIMGVVAAGGLWVAMVGCALINLWEGLYKR